MNSEQQDAEDLAMGRQCRELREKLEASEEQTLLLMTCARILISTAIDLNALDTANVTLRNVTQKGVPAGDWVVKTIRLKAPKKGTNGRKQEAPYEMMGGEE